MKYRALAYAGVVLGVVAMASSFAVPFASGSTKSTATISATCSTTSKGVLFVDYAYTGFSGGVRGVEFSVSNVANSDIVDAVKGGSGGVRQAFDAPPGSTSPFTFTGISAQLVNQSGKMIAGSSTSADPESC